MKSMKSTELNQDTMFLKKIADDHYVVVTDEPIKEGNWFYNPHLKEIHQAINPPYPSDMFKITHSTKPLNTDFNDWFDVKMIDLSYVKSLFGESIDYDKADEILHSKWCRDDNRVSWLGTHTEACIIGYEKAIDDNRHKRFSEDDLRKAFEYGKLVIIYNSRGQYTSQKEKQQAFEQLTQPKDTWEVYFDENNDLKLK